MTSEASLGLIPRSLLRGVSFFNQFGEMLIQKRAKEKYHSGGLWSNACCSHQITEDVLTEANKRLFEELGIQCDLRSVFIFHYLEKVSTEMIENETDEVLIGVMNKCIVYPSLAEADEVKWVGMTDLIDDIRINTNKYTVWFKIILEMIQNSYMDLIEKSML